MNILTTKGWDQYALLDSGDGERLEQFGKYVLVRPDPQAIWQRKLSKQEWDKADAKFKRIKEDRGTWITKKSMSQSWTMSWNDIVFQARLSPFKHTGVFPEQVLQWQWIQDKIVQAKRPVSVLNLFGYTGIASVAAAAVGAKVTHVDASRPAIAWARENQKLSGLEDKPIRWILDDALKFVQREVKRGVMYDGILMDPPVYGHGPTGQIWKFSEHFPQLLMQCAQILTKHPLFVIINAYAISSSALMLQNVLKDIIGDQSSEITVGELVLEEKSHQRLLSTGMYARVSFK